MKTTHNNKKAYTHEDNTPNQYKQLKPKKNETNKQTNKQAIKQTKTHTHKHKLAKQD